MTNFEILNLNSDLSKLQPGDLPKLEGSMVLTTLEGWDYYSSIPMVRTSSCFHYIKGHDESNVKMAEYHIIYLKTTILIGLKVEDAIISIGMECCCDTSYLGSYLES